MTVEQIDKQSNKILFREFFTSYDHARYVQDHHKDKRNHPQCPQRTADKLIVRRNIVNNIHELSGAPKKDVNALQRHNEFEQRAAFETFAAGMKQKERRHKYRRREQQTLKQIDDP